MGLMKKNKLLLTFLTTAAVSLMSFSAMAGTWMWLDTNGDGLAACYYFIDYDTVQHGGQTEDGYTVDENGAWCENGVVVERSVLTDKAHENIEFSGTTDTSNENNGKYHFVSASYNDGNTTVSSSFSGVDIRTLQVNIDEKGSMNLAIAYDDGQIGTITLPKNQDGSYTMSTLGGDVTIAFSNQLMTWSGSYYGIPTVLTAVKE